MRNAPAPRRWPRYNAKLEIYQRARAAYERQHEAYWNAVSAKRKARFAKRRHHEAIALADYVLTQPPVYAGPPRPVSPLPPPPKPPAPPQAEEIPVVADFLQAAREQWDFVPELPASDAVFKRAYAKAARAAGLTHAQIVGVYAFETGGRGDYDTQAGLEPPGPGKHAISPAIGYNQLLSTNTVSLFGEKGQHFLAVLERKPQTLKGEAHRLHAQVRRAQAHIAYCRSLPHRWSEYDEIAKHTPKGWGIHAAVLDIDIGPLLQVQKLLDSVHFARAKGYAAPLTAAELELMNLTGDGNGFDMVNMPPTFARACRPPNFFQRHGYERNPVARRTGVVAALVADIQGEMNRLTNSPGASEMAAAY